MKIENCRICNHKSLIPFLDYGNIALADSFIEREEDIKKEKKYPLKLCLCNNCKHVQIDEVVDPKLLFEIYPWETGISKSIQAFAEELYQKAIRCHYSIPSPQKTRVIEIASNDGSILSIFQKNGCEILGIDPAKNIVEKANENGIQSLARFFNLETALSIKKEYGVWDICLARNVLAHVQDLHGLTKGIQEITAKEGFAIIEVPHLKTMFQELQYDQVFHEHLGYHSLDSIQKLFGQYAMEVFDVEEIWIHGGSIRVFLQHRGGPRKISKNVDRIWNEEEELGLYNESSWKQFAKRAITHKNALLSELKGLKEKNQKIAIYGASGKGQSLLQFCNIGYKIIDFVVDKSQMKQNKWTPGTHIKIFPPSHIYEVKPNTILLCAWNFAKEIVEQEKRFLSEGGQFLHPFPLPHYIK